MTLLDETDNKAFLKARAQMAAANSRAEVIEAIRATARVAFGSDGVTFVLRDGECCHYVEEDAITPLWKGQRFPLESCISGWSMLNAQTAVIRDIYADPRIPQDAYRPTFVKSLIMTPVGNKPVAAIGAYWAEQREFTQAEIAMVQTVAKAVGRAFEDLPAA